AVLERVVDDVDGAGARRSHGNRPARARSPGFPARSGTPRRAMASRRRSATSESVARPDTRPGRAVL
ncbi:MAG: hypothetical protein AVDCRST_MAG38-2298, partial [uncultured Solirubrobacteraceae bacterium]